MAEAHDTAAALVDALCASTRRTPTSRRSAACAAAARPAATSTSWPPAPPTSLMDAFTSYELVERVLAHGDTKSSVLLWGGFQADLRLVPRESLGAALQYFTGSKAHNIALARPRHQARLQAERVRPLSPGRRRQPVAGSTEEDVYRALGLAFVPPELRENRGEIEAAERGALPRS